MQGAKRLSHSVQHQGDTTGVKDAMDGVHKSDAPKVVLLGQMTDQ